MHLMTIQVEIQIRPGFRSKRQMIRSILDKIHRHFNVAITELEGGSHPARSTLGIAALATHNREVRATLDRVLKALGAHPRVEISEVEWTNH